MKILVVDDEAHVRRMMALTLEAAGYEVGEAASGEDAIVRYGDGSAWDAVVLDQKMPGIDGLETLKRILDRRADARVLLVTAFASIELAVDAMRMGATDFLRKPMTPETLRAAVAAALDGRMRARQKTAEAGAPPPIATLTLNGFRILREPKTTSGEHRFRICHASDPDIVVSVAIDPEAVARVARLLKRTLSPDGAFWREQAERLLAAVVWSEGRAPGEHALVVRDLSREDLEAAAAWPLD